jgi:cysteine synthase A
MPASASVVDAIGATPLVELGRITADLDGSIFAKLEYLNPGFSKKDRSAKQIIDEAEAAGEIAPGQTVIELTSGNMGTGLAIVCAVRGYPFVAVMSEGNSEERATMMRAFGAEVVLVPQCEDSVPGEVSGADLQLVEEQAQRLTEQRGAFRADQFNHPGNWHAHYSGTAAEIWQQCDGKVTAFCDFVGSGGTFAGCSRYLKEKNPDLRCYVVEPDGAAVLSGQPATDIGHPLQGGGYAMSDLALLDDVHIDGYVSVSAEESTRYARLLASREGIFAGYSSGANVAAAMRLLQGELKGAHIAVVICDSGLKYLTSELWT